MKSTFDCAVLGDWHLAFVTATCIAKQGHRTVLVNHAATETSKWETFPAIPVLEPGLSEMIAECRENGLLEFRNGVTSDWAANLVWMAIDTPINEKDEVDVSSLLAVANQVRACGNLLGKTFAVSSQVPVGFNGQLASDLKVDVAYIPENLRLGRGIETFMNADRTVIGASTPAAAEQVKTLLSGFETEFLLCDLVTAEMVKHATNVYLATSISFANELARIGEFMGVDNQFVAQALKKDKRIGKQAYVAPGLGFAGGTLPRDLRVIQRKGLETRIKTPLVNAVLEVNEAAAASLVFGLETYLGTLKNKKILVLGYTYKADTDALRRSPSIDLATELTRAGATVLGFDPMISAQNAVPLKDILEHHVVWNAIPRDLDAMVIMTGRPQFKSLDWKQFQDSAPRESDRRVLVLDTCNIANSAEILGSGLAFKQIWQPVQLPV